MILQKMKINHTGDAVDHKQSVADLRVRELDAPPPRGPNSLIFMQCWEIWQNRMLAPPP